MKKFFPFLLLFIASIQSYGTTHTPLQYKASLPTVLLLRELEDNKGTVTPAMVQQYCLSSIKGTYYAGGLVLVDKNTIDNALQHWNARVGTRAGNIYSVKLPLANLQQFINEQSVSYFELDKRAYGRMDSVRQLTGVALVQKGTFLPHGYTGKGVVFGDMDGGFDYTHPNFYDSTGTNYRVKRVWEQDNDAGPAPADFGYGTERTTKEDMLTRRFSDSLISHGTHVSGIAAGGGWGKGGRYKGIAPESELVFVNFTVPDDQPFLNTTVSATTTGLLDGINYTYLYAQSVGEPAVVNMSLGTHIGPHDGTSLFDQACDAVVGPGQILVGAAGNEGGMEMHYRNDFSTDTTIRFSYVGFQGTSGLGLLDAWGSFGTDFSLEFYLKGGNSTGRIYASQNFSGGVVTLTNPRGDTCYIQLASSGNNAINHKPEILALMQNVGWAKGGDTLVIEIGAGRTGNNGRVDVWNAGAGNGAIFFGDAPNFKGDKIHTMGEVGGTGKSIITVGAFTSKNEYTNIFGEHHAGNAPAPVGAIAPFSSRGPTIDGRTKPDITAPGNFVVSSVSNADLRYALSGGQFAGTIVDTLQGSNTTWSFATLQGTSMAAPVVAGVVALMLEANPMLTQAQIKTILQQSALRDADVLSEGAAPNNTWGYGKVSALSAMLTTTPVNEISKSRLSIYPNPTQGYLTILSTDEPMQLEICDLAGRQILSEKLSGSINRLDVNSFAKGVYLLRVQQGSKVFCEKVVVE